MAAVDAPPETAPRRRRAIRVALVAIFGLLCLVVGLYLGHNRVADLFPTGDAVLPAVSAPKAVEPPRPRDGDRVVLAGRIVSALPHLFVLDHGGGRVTVEMDDWKGAWREGTMLREGDRVVVVGRLDDDLYRRARIEAGGVFVDSIDTWFYADAADEENLPLPGGADRYADLVGTVGSVGKRSLTLVAGGESLLVLTGEAADGEGPALKSGDRVRVWGDLILAGKDPTLNAKGLTRLRARGSAG